MTVHVLMNECELEISATRIMHCHGELRKDITPAVALPVFQEAAAKAGYVDLMRFGIEVAIANALLDDLIERSADRDLSASAIVAMSNGRDHEHADAIRSYFGDFTKPLLRTQQAISEMVFRDDRMEEEDGPHEADMRKTVGQLRKLIDSTRARAMAKAQDEAVAEKRRAAGIPDAADGLAANVRPFPPKQTQENATRSPGDQFQIGCPVLYKQEGVVTEVVGYLWETSLGSLPAIRGYELSCGITVPKEALERWPSQYMTPG